MNEQDSSIAAVYRSKHKKLCRRYALVLASADIQYDIQRDGKEFALLVHADDSERAQTEIDAYRQENRNWKSTPIPTMELSNGWMGVYWYVAVMLVVTILAREDYFSRDWSELGKTHAGLIRNGHWWRTITALFLHSGFAHLAGNLVIGSLFGLFAGQMFGSGLAWLSILVTGAFGNYINAWWNPTTHTSVGASTAVFAALGMVAASAWTQRRQSQQSKLRRLMPLVSGIALLGYLGTGGVRTDVGAHAAGADRRNLPA